MAKRKEQTYGGMSIKQDAGRIQFPVGPDGRVSICGKKKRLSMNDDVKKFRQ
jgi:hypothetical protein